MKDSTYYGFFNYLDKDKEVVHPSPHVHCSMGIKAISNYPSKVKYLQVVFPDDWLPTKFRQKRFIKCWLAFVSKWFFKTTYVGQLKYQEAFPQETFESVTKLFNNTLTKQVDGVNFTFNVSSSINNDRWHEVLIEVDHGHQNRSMLTYCAYCLVRYLYCSDYQELVNDFFRVKDMIWSYGLRLDDFEVLWICHYMGHTYYNYYTTYSLLKQLLDDNAVPKIVPISEFRKLLEPPAKDALHNTIVYKDTKVFIRDMKKAYHINPANFKQIYEQIK